MSNNLKAIIISLSFFLILGLNSLFTVEQHEQAIVFQFGKIIRVIKEPGLKFKIPLVNKVTYYDKRILNVTVDDKEIIAKDQKRLIVNAFAKYQIIDAKKFYQSVRDEYGIKIRLNSILDSSLRQTLSEAPLSALLTSKRSELMRRIQQVVNAQSSGFGIDVIDVRISRADLPKENSQAIYKRMQTDREKEAREFRAEGEEEAQRIKSRADREVIVIIAEAQKNANILKGEGDAQATKIFADAINTDPSFFNFFRSMQAYKKTLSNRDSLIISPDSKFFKFFSNLSQ